MNKFISTVQRLSAPTQFGDVGNGEVFIPAQGAISRQPFVKLDCRRARGADGLTILLPRHEYPVVLVETTN